MLLISKNVQKTLITVAIIIFCFIIYMVAMFFNSLESVARDINQKEKATMMKSESTSSRELARVIMAALEKDFAIVDRSIVKEGEELYFIKVLEDSALRAGVNQTLNIDFDKDSKAIPAGEIGKIGISVTVKSSYEDLLNYFEELDRFPYYVIINTVSIRNGRNSLKQGKGSEISSVLKGYFYWEH